MCYPGTDHNFRRDVREWKEEYHTVPIEMVCGPSKMKRTSWTAMSHVDPGHSLEYSALENVPSEGWSVVSEPAELAEGGLGPCMDPTAVDAF